MVAAPFTKPFERDLESLVDGLNEISSRLNGELVKATPSGIGGRLRRSWAWSPATKKNPQATVGTNSSYFLPLELGRKPGKGISVEGQKGVALWARRKLSLNQSQATSFAFNLSQKYKREGRPAVGFLGLASPGSPASSIPKSPVPGSILAKAFSDVEKLLKTV
jgi:hypothetical protein